MTFVEYKQLSPLQKFGYNCKNFFKKLPKSVGGFFVSIGKAIAKFFIGIVKGFKNYGTTFAKGDWATKLSYLIFGAGDLHKGKTYKGVLYFLAEVLYALYMIFFGWNWIKDFITLGTIEQTTTYDELGFPVTVPGDDSMLILLYSTVTIIITVIVFAIYISNIKDAYRHQLMVANGEKPTDFKTDIREFLDGKYHITLLSFPVLMIGIFNIMPLIFMILIAFTNYDAVKHKLLFDWVGMDQFVNLFDVINSTKKASTFFGIAGWTLVWAVAATFSNYILGMIVALMINKKGIKLKALWRTLFVITIAVPQFVSLLLMQQILSTNGAFNILLSFFNGGVNPKIDFLGGEVWVARLTVIIVNCWVGIPYTILSMSGILMNIPEDLYESARIDGASPVKTFTAITLPYMIFVTTPQLITQFVGNINNFNVIFLLTGGKPTTPDYFNAGKTDILVTWLYNLSMGEKGDYGLASAIGIVVFVICATLSLIIYNNSKSMKDEEAFS